MATVTPNPVRIGYPHLFKARGVKQNDGTMSAPKFSLTMMIPKDDEKTYNAVKALVDAAIEEGRKNGKLPKKGTAFRNPIRDGDETDTDENPENAGHWLVNANASEDRPPVVVDMQRAPIMDQNEVYGGMWAYVAIGAYPYGGAGISPGVGVGVNAVMKHHDDDAFGGAPRDAESIFEGVERPESGADELL